MSAMSPIRSGALGVALVDASYPSEVLTVSLQQENEELKKWIRKSTLEVNRVIIQNDELKQKLEESENINSTLMIKKERIIKERDESQKQLAGLRQSVKAMEENTNSANRQIDRMNASISTMKNDLTSLGVSISRVVVHRSSDVSSNPSSLQQSLLVLHNNLSDVVSSVRQALRLNPEILTRVRSPNRVRPPTTEPPPSPTVAVPVASRISPQRPARIDSLRDWENSAVVTPTSLSYPSKAISPPREVLSDSFIVSPVSELQLENRKYGLI